VSIPGERDQVKGIVWVEVVEREVHRLFGLVEWKAGHRTRSAENKDEFFWHNVSGINALGWL
jgi:hypothetical protein